jgi:plastocyanin
LACASLFVTSCGDDDGPTAPSGGGATGGSIAATITITASGASPRNVTVAAGSRVTFVNNDSRAHDMNSDPHPEHTDCTEINVGDIQAGASRTTQNLTRARTCGFHDHNQPTVTALQGTITVQ